MRRLALAALLAVSPLAGAQSPADPPLYPAIDPSKSLRGAALVQALRGGGYVLYMRHARQGGPQTLVPCTKRDLTDEGEAQARKVAAGIRRLGIPIGSVHTSEHCRAVETARLMGFGEPQPTTDLNPTNLPPTHAARRARLNEAPPPGRNALLVSHVQSADQESDRLSAPLAGIVVFKPAAGGPVPVARIALEDWDRLENAP